MTKNDEQGKGRENMGVNISRKPIIHSNKDHCML